MLSKETKKKIDDARDILVGQLPLPSDQVELITIALIYKFMDDQDEDLRQLGFQEAFFTDDLKQYSWQRLMSNEIDAEERVQTFIKGIDEVQKAAHIPQLFRDIFKNTFLKFRDGRTLHLFLGVINGFRYDHSEELGNAFEYLLMSMGAQGENGQFRTPRNIIDFIVEVVDPDKGDTILDPACGTGGFLLSAFKHVLRKHTSGMEHYRITLNNEDIEGIPVNWGDRLTTQDLQRLGESIEGYDITPLMTRLARVNLFLHQFKSPRIHEYDTLTSDGRWKDKYDCILANPPFMTPKGGVSTHSKFRIRATKAEVLFSDYILEHLTPDGKAGFIVPEGIIFQNSGDYTELRKWLVETAGLWAVVSLPAQVFQPYSGVKTSILFIDRELARTRDEIILVKVENDGYSLNTNRNKIGKNDLPEALQMLTIGKKSLSELREYLGENGGKANVPKVLIRPRSEFARLDAYKAQTAAFSLVRKQWEKCKALEEELKANPSPASPSQGRSLSSPLSRRDRGGLKTARLQTAFAKQTAEFYKIAEVRYEKIGNQPLPDPPLDKGGRKARSRLLPCQGEAGEGLGFASLQTFFDTRLKDAAIAFGADRTQTAGLSLPLREHLDGEREYCLSGDRYREESVSEGVWPVVELRQIIDELESGVSVNSDNRTTADGEIGILKTSCVTSGTFLPEEHKTVVQDELERVRCCVKKNSIIISRMNTEALVGANAYVANDYPNLFLPDRLWQAVISRPDVEVRYVQFMLASDVCRSGISAKCGGTSGSMKNISKPQLLSLQIPLPPLAIQKQIVAEIEGYQKVIEGCNLVENYDSSFGMDPAWPVVKLGDIADLKNGLNYAANGAKHRIKIFGVSSFKSHLIAPIEDLPEIELDHEVEASYLLQEGDILFVRSNGNQELVGRSVMVPAINEQVTFSGFTIRCRFTAQAVLPKFYALLFKSAVHAALLKEAGRGANIRNLSQGLLKELEIPLPPLEIQQKIVADLEEDLAAVAGARRLKSKMEAKIKAVIDRVWGGKA